MLRLFVDIASFRGFVTFWRFGRLALALTRRGSALPRLQDQVRERLEAPCQVVVARRHANSLQIGHSQLDMPVHIDS